MCKGVEMGEGISNPLSDNAIPAKIDMISGFFESLFATRLIPWDIVDFSSLYNSSTVIDVVTLITEMVEADNAARCSPS
jgi:hypothetical protein